MKQDNNGWLKLGFGGLIFIFSISLAYFTANYVDNSNESLSDINYWATLAAFAGVYVTAGIAVSSVFSVSLGFLFSSTVLIIHMFVEKYPHISDKYKVLIIGSILIILYVMAWWKLNDSDDSELITQNTFTAVPENPQV